MREENGFETFEFDFEKLTSETERRVKMVW